MKPCIVEINNGKVVGVYIGKNLTDATNIAVSLAVENSTANGVEVRKAIEQQTGRWVEGDWSVQITTCREGRP